MENKSNYTKLADFGRELLHKKSLMDGLPLISMYAKDVLGADRCSIFINDLQKGELWTTLADGMDKIIIPQGKGIVGQTIDEKRIILVNDTYSSQAITEYPATTSAPVGQSGGVQLQIAALKDYYTAEDYKNRLSLAPGLSAYVQRGAMNKVIVTGIPSVAEANRLKESRFPGAFIVSGGTSSSYTPPVQPNYSSTSGGAYNVNNPYGTPSSSPYATTSSNSGIGVQIGAFGSRGKAQSVANSQSGQYPATVKKVGRLYKVILTGFSSRSAAKSHAGRVGGFVVSTY